MKEKAKVEQEEKEKGHDAPRRHSYESSFSSKTGGRKDVRDSHSTARRKHVEKLLLFAEEIKWPYLDKLRGHILPRYYGALRNCVPRPPVTKMARVIQVCSGGGLRWWRMLGVLRSVTTLSYCMQEAHVLLVGSDRCQTTGWGGES